MKMKSVFTNITAGLCFAVLVLSMGYMSFCRNKQEVLCSDVLRFHILSNSDKPEDMAIKYKVRDALTPVAQELFSDCQSFEEARKTAKENESLLESTAQKIVEGLGKDYRVSVHTGEKEYGTRILSGSVYPGGKYCSVTVSIGKGEGANVWCVLFSPFSDIGIEWQEGDGKTKPALKILDWIRNRQRK